MDDPRPEPARRPDPPREPPRDPHARRANGWLALGAAAGLAAAAAGLLAPSGTRGGLPDDAVASVNGALIRAEEYERAVRALAADRREPLGDAERRHVLERLLDEELLVQRGLELGLARHDRRVRGDIVSAVIELVVSQADAEEPGDAEVRAFYADNRAYFAHTDRLQVRQVLVRGRPVRGEDAARERAAEAARRLRAGDDFTAVDDALGDDVIARVPADLLPAAKLREYLGPTATRAALALEEGAVSEPVRSASGWHVIELVRREPGFAPPLAEVEAEVRAELRRRAGDRALRAYLEALREEADVRVAEEAP